MTTDDFLSVNELEERDGAYLVTPSLPPPRAQATPVMDRGAIRSMLGDAGFVVPGVYTARTLYDAYRERADAPVSQRVFGANLRAMGAEPVTRVVNGKGARCWKLRRSVLDPSPDPDPDDYLSTPNAPSPRRMAP